MLLLGPAAALPGQSLEENWKECKSDDPENSIQGCSALIQSRQTTGTNLAKAFYDRGLAFAHKGDYDRAIQDYDEALRLTPIFADAFYSRGAAHANEGDYDHAFQDYDQALRLKPSLANALYDRGLAFAHKGDYDRAI